MTELKEVFELVTKQTEPDLDSWKELEQRQRRTVRNRKFGALAAAAAIGIAAVVIAVQALDDGRDTRPVVTPPTRETGRDLYVVDPETGDATLLLAAPGDQTNPERSPDGARVVYVSEPPGSPPQIFVLEADGTERQLTALEGGAEDPTWSPDGRQIAFAGRDPNADIFVMNVDGSRIRRLAGTPEHESHPDWSPDGAQIAFQSGLNRGDRHRSEIWVVSVPDGTLTQLPPRGYHYHGADPAWSPDGRWVALTQFAPGTLNLQIPYAALRLARPDGTQAHRLANGKLFFSWRQNPSWSPDGRSIVFEDLFRRGPFGDRTDRVRVIDVKSGHLRTILTNVRDAQPSWGTEGILVSKIGSD